MSLGGREGGGSEERREDLASSLGDTGMARAIGTVMERMGLIVAGLRPHILFLPMVDSTGYRGRERIGKRLSLPYHGDNNGKNC